MLSIKFASLKFAYFLKTLTWNKETKTFLTLWLQPFPYLRRVERKCKQDKWILHNQHLCLSVFLSPLSLSVSLSLPLFLKSTMNICMFMLKALVFTEDFFFIFLINWPLRMRLTDLIIDDEMEYAHFKSVVLVMMEEMS